MRILFLFLLTLLTIPALAKNSCNEKIQKIQTKTVKYLKQIKEILIENTPIPELADQEKKNWINEGYAKALKKIKNVKTEADSYGVLYYYTNGFHDSHTEVYQKVNNTKFITPMFSLLKDNEKYIVSNADESLKNIKNGDEIILCDGYTLLVYYKKYLYPYVDSPPPPQSWDLTAIFVNKGNSFIKYPKQCTFRTPDGKTYTEELNWNGKYIDPFYNPKFSQIKQNDGSIWLTIPSFSTERTKECKSALKMLKENPNPTYVVFDLRGNGGGSTENAFPLIEAIYGTDYLKSLEGSSPLNQKNIFSYKVTQGNFNYYKSYLRSDNKGIVSHAKKLLKPLEKSLKTKQKICTITDSTFYKYRGMVGMNKPYPPVFFITDISNGSTCWQFVRALKALPGTYQIGDRTYTEQNPTEMRAYPIGDNFILSAPTAWIISLSGYLGKPFMPEVPFTRNLYNTEKLKDYIKYYYSLIKE